MDAPKSCLFFQPHIPEAIIYQLCFLWYKITKSNEFGFEHTGSLITDSPEMGMPVLMKSTSFVEPSGEAGDHYNRYEEDIRLMAEAGLNCYRFSIEWARIEPVEGQFDETEVEHYRKVIRCCKENGITPIVTLHHFTCPKWLISMGAWEAESAVEDFNHYCFYIAAQLGSEMHCFFGLTGIAAAHTVSDVCAVMIAVGFCLWQYRQLAGMTSTQ